MVSDSEEMAAAQALVGRRAGAVKLEGRFWPTLGGRLVLPRQTDFDGHGTRADAVAAAKRHRAAATCFVESCAAPAFEVAA